MKRVIFSTLAIGLALWMGGVGLHALPGSDVWWLMRPAWIAVYILLLLPFALGFGRFERSAAATPEYPAWRLVSGGVLMCAGLGLLALDGVAGVGWFSLQTGVLMLLFAGAIIAGVNPLRK